MYVDQNKIGVQYVYHVGTAIHTVFVPIEARYPIEAHPPFLNGNPVKKCYS